MSNALACVAAFGGMYALTLAALVVIDLTKGNLTRHQLADDALLALRVPTGAMTAIGAMGALLAALLDAGVATGHVTYGLATYLMTLVLGACGFAVAVVLGRLQKRSDATCDTGSRVRGEGTQR